MGQIIIPSIYHPEYRHFPTEDPDRGRPERPTKRLYFCSRLCSYECPIHLDFSTDSKQEMQDHLRESEDHSI